VTRPEGAIDAKLHVDDPVLEFSGPADVARRRCDFEKAIPSSRVSVLVQAGRVTDEWTLTDLHRRFARRIDRQVRALLGPDDEREDLVQDVLIAVFRRIGTLRDPACIDAWVSQITANMLKHTMRRGRLRRHASWEALPEEQNPTVQLDLEAHQLAVRAMSVMDRLPPTDRTLLCTYWLSAATLRSMAADAGCSIITVRRRLLRAQARFERLARRDPALAARIDTGSLYRNGRGGVRGDTPVTLVAQPAELTLL
jgi:RNA polymerase sigma-70 factor, ECF subfamily